MEHEELGTGTVTSIPNRSKVVVFFHVRKSAKLCPLNSVKTLPIHAFRVDQLPMSDTVMGIWSSLVQLAGSGDGTLLAGFSSIVLPHVLSGPPTKAIQKSNDDGGINVHL